MAILFISAILATVVVTTCGLNENYAGLSSRKFAARIYQELSKDADNVLVSPASLLAVLGLLQMGAEGPTAAELSQALSLPLDRNQLITNLTSIPSTLHSNPSVEVALASAIYARHDVRVAEQFRASAAALGAAVRPLGTNLNAAVVDVNSWLSSVTRGLLGNVLKPEDITTDTTMLLVNALYFKGQWQDAIFRENDTELTKFYRRGETVPVNMMKCLDYFYIGRDYELRATYLDLAYKGDDFVLTIVLPNDVDGLSRLIDNIDRVLNSPPPLYEEQVDLRIPRFRANGEARLKPVLQRMGVQHAFGNAHFTGLTADGKPLAVSDVVHNTLLDVNEKGTEAAAVSVAGLVDKISASPVSFNADHPFLYFLQHKPSGLILFIGHYTGSTS